MFGAKGRLDMGLASLLQVSGEVLDGGLTLLDLVPFTGVTSNSC